MNTIRDDGIDGVEAGRPPRRYAARPGLLRKWLPYAAAALVLFAVLAVLTACAESSSEATAVVNPDEATIDSAFVQRAQAVLAEAASPEDGWRFGVVYIEQESPWTLGVLTPDGAVAIEDARDYCGEGDWRVLDAFVVLVDPGDLVEWSTAGDDDRVCGSEIRLVEKAVAL